MKHIIEEDELMTIIETYRVPVGNSSAGEMAAEWTMDALQDIKKEIQSVVANSPQAPDTVPLEKYNQLLEYAHHKIGCPKSVYGASGYADRHICTCGLENLTAIEEAEGK